MLFLIPKEFLKNFHPNPLKPRNFRKSKKPSYLPGEISKKFEKMRIRFSVEFCIYNDFSRILFNPRHIQKKKKTKFGQKP
jgi:hypothetical protein